MLKGLPKLQTLSVSGCCFDVLQCSSNTVKHLILNKYHFDNNDPKDIGWAFPKLQQLTLNGEMCGELHTENDCRECFQGINSVTFFDRDNKLSNVINTL